MRPISRAGVAASNKSYGGGMRRSGCTESNPGFDERDVQVWLWADPEYVELGHSQKRFSLATESARAKLRSRKMPGMAARTLIESA